MCHPIFNPQFSFLIDPALNYDLDTAPPVFTHATRMSKLYHTKSVGETFAVSCEALGSPQPEIFWFKDGQHIDESVSFKNGRSTVEFSVLGKPSHCLVTLTNPSLILAFSPIQALLIAASTLAGLATWSGSKR